ncbi:MAG: hypothetical protein HYZ48_05820 [Chlamydiales bacterium]|nr:hypothetical protein [Chlamydiales bacterium]
MNFTREPIIETVISPKDGFKLLVRSSKGGDGEEYYVDAVEVVCFGRAFFFRSLEKPKAFLVPVSDYEVLEVKETRVALKNVSHERNIKIGGGREGFGRQRDKEIASPKEDLPESSEELEGEEAPMQMEEASSEARTDRRRDRRRHRRRRPSEGGQQQWSDRNKSQESQEHGRPASTSDQVGEGGGAKDETKVSSSMFSALLPPPTTLISQTIGRYKDKEAAESTPPAPQEERKKPLEKEKPQNEGFQSESSPLNRVSAPEESGSFTTTHFSTLDQGFLPPF